MHPIRLLFAIVAVLFVTAVPTALAVDGSNMLAQADEQEMDRTGPAVLVEDDVSAPDEEAWTFRFLIPTLIAVTALGIAAVVIAYGVRLRGRYRVVE